MVIVSTRGLSIRSVEDCSASNIGFNKVVQKCIQVETPHTYVLRRQHRINNCKKNFTETLSCTNLTVSTLVMGVLPYKLKGV